MRRRGQQDHIHMGDHLLVSLEAGEHRLRSDGNFWGKLRIVLEAVQALLHPVEEGIAHGDELDILIRVEGLPDRPGPTAAAADEANAKDIAAGGIDLRRHQSGRDGRASDRSGGLEKITARRGLR